MTEEYIAIFEHPVSMSLLDMILGHDMLHTMVRNTAETTKIHLVSIADGTVTTIDSGIFF